MKYKIIEKSFFLRSFKVAAPLSSIVGFIGDFLQPVIEYASIALIASFVLTFISGLFWFAVARPKLKLRLELKDISEDEFKELSNSNLMASAFSFFFIFCFVSAAIFGGQQLWAKDNQGIIASQVPEFAVLQKRILKLETEIEGVKVEVAEVKKNVEVQKQELAEVKDVVTDVSKVVGPVLDPKGKKDFFHNTLFYYKSGNLEKGKLSLVSLMSQEDHQFDELLHVFNVVKTFHGVPFATSLHTELSEDYKDHVTLMMAKLNLYELTDSKNRAEILRKIIEKEPNFTPAYAYLLRTYFGKMPKSPEGYRHYFKEVDQLLARMDEKALENFYGLNPTLTYDQSILKLDLEMAQRIRSKWDFSKDFEFQFTSGYSFRAKVDFGPYVQIESLSYSFNNESYIDPFPGQKYSSLFPILEIPLDAETIFIKYKTQDGVEHGPVQVKEKFFELMIQDSENKLAEVMKPSSNSLSLYSFLPALYLSKELIIKTQNGEKVIEIPHDKNILSPDLYRKKYAAFVEERRNLDRNDPLIGIQFLYRNGQKSPLK